MNVLNYRVQKTDSIQGICQIFKIDKLEFQSLNKTEKVFAGQIVKVTIKQKCVVMPADNLHSLSKKLCALPDVLKEKFGEKFFIGQLLEL